ncbi:glutamine cyclotransferase [Novosphingobium sp. PhB57]|nr:glutamine cyclotransferase [Novosphingobium sp. PhB57]TDW63819.1 glutamine cyclotransferase [Novosphingobium sp. PhB55]
MRHLHRMNSPVRALLAAALALTAAPAAQAKDVPVCGYRIDNAFPHDTAAFTEGLFFDRGLLYESTGQKGDSRIVVRKLETLEPVGQIEIDPAVFGEGLIDWNGQLISLTWRDGIGYRWDRTTLKPLGTFHYEGEGWGMTRSGNTIYQSDGSAALRLRDPATMRQTGSLAVTAEGKPVENLNELEWIDGEIWANVWMTDRIARIDPKTGKVKSWLDLAGLREQAGGAGVDAVLNGIAWDAPGRRIFVTGKNWNQIFQITPACTKGA